MPPEYGLDVFPKMRHHGGAGIKEPPFWHASQDVSILSRLILYTVSNPEKRYHWCQTKHTFSQSNHSFLHYCFYLYHPFLPLSPTSIWPRPAMFPLQRSLVHSWTHGVSGILPALKDLGTLPAFAHGSEEFCSCRQDHTSKGFWSSCTRVCKKAFITYAWNLTPKNSCWISSLKFGI